MSACAVDEAPVSPVDVGVDVAAEATTSCGRREGEACTFPGALIDLCRYGDGQGAILLCCTGAKIARELPCTDVWLHPTCDGFAPRDAAGESDGADAEGGAASEAGAEGGGD